VVATDRPLCLLIFLLTLTLPTVAHRCLLRSLQPKRVPHGRQPVELGIPFKSIQSVVLKGPDDADLFAWFIQPDSASLAPVPAVVIMHGWGCNASDMLPAAPALRDAGMAVLVMDARCHGLSDGAAFTSLPRFAEDIDAGLSWLAKQSDVDPDRLAVMGHSVGAGAALLCASRRRDVRAVISLSAFAHPQEVMQSWLTDHHIPVQLLGQWILRHVQQVVGAQFDVIAPVSTVSKIRCPIMIVHGVQDETVPVQDAHRILRASGQSADSLLLVPGGHDLTESLEDGHLQSAIHFMENAFLPGAPIVD